jgi:hypothetical protein
MTIWTIKGRLGLTGTVDNSTGSMVWNITAPSSVIGNFTYGLPTDIPLVGDWNGDGAEGIGAYDPSSGIFWLKQIASGGADDIFFIFGVISDIPISWYDTKDNADRVGIIRKECALLDSTLAAGYANVGVKTIGLVQPPTGTISQCTIPSGTNIGVASVLSNPAGAEVFIDDIDTGNVTPYNICGLPSGAHSYRLTLSGHSDVTGQINIVSYVNTTVSVTMPIAGGGGGTGTCSDPLNLGCMSGIPNTFILGGAVALIMMMKKKN